MLSWAASLSSITFTQRCSSASDIRAGMSTMVRSPSLYAETVLLRRLLLRTSTALVAEARGGRSAALRGWVPALRAGVSPAKPGDGSAGTP
ncbi:hypothetical protein GCM10010207_03010 [Streptomyces atratus]|nr:hypothetical protein GCM10010207_03010 [Streptomyces atratus]